MKKRYLYVGAFVNKRTNELFDSNERKVGVTNDLTQRENDLNSTKFPIGYQIIAAWDFGVDGDAYLFEKELHNEITLLSPRYGEWFDNSGIENYVRYRTKKIATEIDLEILSGISENEKTIIRKVGDKSLRTRICELAGQEFYAERFGARVGIKVTESGKFRSLVDGIEHSSPGAPIRKVWIDLVPIGSTSTAELNGWELPRNERGNSLDQELALLPMALQPDITQ